MIGRYFEFTQNDFGVYTEYKQKHRPQGTIKILCRYTFMEMICSDKDRWNISAKLHEVQLEVWKYTFVYLMCLARDKRVQVIREGYQRGG